jgi:hypothetical protein
MSRLIYINIYIYIYTYIYINTYTYIYTYIYIRYDPYGVGLSDRELANVKPDDKLILFEELILRRTPAEPPYKGDVSVSR